MDDDSKRWHEITPSSFDHERAALRYVRDLLPDRVPYEAWSNFTFVSDQGHIREVDLLVVAPTGLFLIEIKNFRGRLTNHGSTWTLTGKNRRSFDNPLPLADQKSKELRTLLKRAAAKERGVNVPFLRGCVFLAEPQMQCELEEGQRSHLYVPDGARSAGTLLEIGADLLLGRVTHAPPQRDFLQALPRLLQRVGVHRTRKSVTVGPWQIEPRPYDTGPTWQDHNAGREDLPGEYRRIRIYLYERQSDAEARESVRHAAQREYLAAQGIEHPGLLVPRDLLDHEMGPALVIDQHRDAIRLDHYMAGDGRSLDLPVRLGLVRQLAEAVGYAHDRRLVHRALSPRAVIVEPGRDATPRLRVGEWQAAARGMSAANTAHQVAPTTHAARHVEAAAAAYLAPEFTQDVDGTTPIDIFGLGATAYLILTGQAPAAGRSELAERLAREGGLSPSAIDESIPPDVDALIALATAPRITERIPDVDEFLAALDDAIGKTTPDPAEEDPWDAQEGIELPDGYTVRRVLGTGATARAFLVERDGLESVLKVGRSADAEDRLGDEATALEGLRHDHLVVLRRGVFALGSARHAIEVDYAGEQTLGRLLREEGAQLPDQLQRFGDQLLDAVGYLADRETFHRDIKPDNLGVRRHPKRGPSLVLFDFSLAGASTANVLAGTRGYRDPFMGSERRPTYDNAAELYSVAVTLHEMASLELPTWGEDGTDPRFVDEVTIASELFDAALRESLTTFFRTALHKDADHRFPTAGAMRQAWRRVFAAADREGPARTTFTPTDDPQQQRDEAAAAATAGTPLVAAGLSARAVAVAQRLGADTVGELIDIPTRMLWRARGLSRATRLELVNRASTWRRSLPTDPGASTPPQDDSSADGWAGLDTLAEQLLPEPNTKGADQRAIMRSLLGLPDERNVLPAERWPSITTVGEQYGLTRARISQLTQKRRLDWLAQKAVTALRDEVVAHLAGRNRVAAAGELVEQMLLSRGCDREEDPLRRRAFGYACLRAVVEADSIAEEPLLAARRHRDRMLVALQVGQDEPFDTPNDAELLDMASALADEAVRLAAADPLPTPVAVVRALETIARRHDQVPGEQRLVQLAAAATATVLTNARLELYPRDLDPIRALRLSQAGAGVPPEGLTPEALARRVTARFPGLSPLPDGPDLAALLREAGFELRWDGDRLVPPRTTLSSSHTPTATGARGGQAAAVTPAEGPAARLQHVLRDGGARVVTFRRSRWAAVRDHVSGLMGEPVVDASAAFVAALREVARERRIADFDVVLRADAAEADARARTNLQRVVAEAWQKLAAAWTGSDTLVLDGLTPFGRYAGGMAVLNGVLDAARRAGRPHGPRTIVLLCAAQDENDAPHVGAEAIGLETAEEWIVAPAAWAAPASVA